MEPLSLRYLSSDNGNCRVYYKSKAGRLYCWQLRSIVQGDFELLTCSRDGEPDCPVREDWPVITEWPTGDERVDADLRAFLENGGRQAA